MQPKSPCASSAGPDAQLLFLGPPDGIRPFATCASHDTPAVHGSRSIVQEGCCRGATLSLCYPRSPRRPCLFELPPIGRGNHRRHQEQADFLNDLRKNHATGNEACGPGGKGAPAYAPSPRGADTLRLRFLRLRSGQAEQALVCPYRIGGAWWCYDLPITPLCVVD